MLALYAFVFGAVFKTRWAGESGFGSFVAMLYAGLIVHSLVSDTLTRSPGAVIANSGYVKKVVFPLELLPVTHLASAVFSAIISLALLALLVMAQRPGLPPTALLAPVVLLPLVVMTAGVAWFLAAMGVFFRDIGQVIGLAMAALLFLSPVFYPVSSAPSMAQGLLYLNPLTWPMEALRAVLVMGAQPDWAGWLAFTAIAVATAASGLWVFQKARPAFADVI